jgi:hypothetical protein
MCFFLFDDYAGMCSVSAVGLEFRMSSKKLVEFVASNLVDFCESNYAIL